jgi:hypothetical protein
MNQCTAKTKSDTRCKRKTNCSSGYCHQHKKSKSPSLFGNLNKKSPSGKGDSRSPLPNDRDIMEWYQTGQKYSKYKKYFM